MEILENTLSDFKCVLSKDDLNELGLSLEKLHNGNKEHMKIIVNLIHENADIQLDQFVEVGLAMTNDMESVILTAHSTSYANLNADDARVRQCMKDAIDMYRNGQEPDSYDIGCDTASDQNIDENISPVGSIYCFNHIYDLASFAEKLSRCHCSNHLYYREDNKKYFLHLFNDAADYLLISNLLSETFSKIKYDQLAIACIQEHSKKMFGDNAIMDMIKWNNL